MWVTLYFVPTGDIKAYPHLVILVDYSFHFKQLLYFFFLDMESYGAHCRGPAECNGAILDFEILGQSGSYSLN